MSVIPRSVLLAYGALSFPLAGTLLVLQVMVPSYYATTLGMNLTVLGGILLVARIIDTVTDPIVGYVSDRTWPRYGKRRLWIILGMPFLMLAMLAVFIPKESMDTATLLFWTCILYVSGTFVIIPMNAWGAELSDDYHQRTRVTAARAMFGLAGVLSVLILPTLLGWGGPDDLQMGLLVNAAMLALFFAIGLGVACAFVPDRARVSLPDKSFRASLSVFREAGSFPRLFWAFFVNAVANSIPAALCVFYVSTVLEDPGNVGLFLVLYFSAMAISTPIWSLVSKRIGKCAAWRVAMLMGAAGLALTPFLGAGDTLWFVAVCIWTGLAGGADLTLPSALLGDQVEADEYRSGARRAGIFYAWWGTATKLSFAVAAGICFPALDLVGFDAGGENSEQSLMLLGLLYGAFPVLLKLIAVAVLSNYPLTYEAYERMRKALHDRRKSGDSSLDPVTVST